MSSAGQPTRLVVGDAQVRPASASARAGPEARIVHTGERATDDHVAAGRIAPPAGG